jgi:hypothetical protein
MSGQVPTTMQRPVARAVTEWIAENRKLIGQVRQLVELLDQARKSMKTAEELIQTLGRQLEAAKGFNVSANQRIRQLELQNQQLASQYALAIHQRDLAQAMLRQLGLIRIQ